MEIVLVRHSKLGLIYVIDEDIPKFDVPLEIIPPGVIHLWGMKIEFDPGTRYQQVKVDGVLSHRAFDVEDLKQLAKKERHERGS